MLTLENGLYLRVQELRDGPPPRPLASGFSAAVAYRALGMFNPSETSDAYFIFSNDRDEIWFICNRHLRLVGVLADQTAARLPLAAAIAWVAAGAALKNAGGLGQQTQHAPDQPHNTPAAEQPKPVPAARST